MHHCGRGIASPLQRTAGSRIPRTPRQPFPRRGEASPRPDLTSPCGYLTHAVGDRIGRPYNRHIADFWQWFAGFLVQYAESISPVGARHRLALTLCGCRIYARATGSVAPTIATSRFLANGSPTSRIHRANLSPVGARHRLAPTAHSGSWMPMEPAMFPEFLPEDRARGGWGQRPKRRREPGG